MDLKLGMLVYIIIQHILVHFQVPIAWTYEIMADFVIFYNKKRSKIVHLLVCKVHILKANALKLLENVYINKTQL